VKKWITVLLISLLAVFVFSAAALADDPDLTIDPHFDPSEPVRLWESVYFSVQSESIRNRSVMFLFNQGNEPDYDNPQAEPLWIWLNEDGYGEAWFTPGVTDVFILDYEDLYNAANAGLTYTAYAQDAETGESSNSVTFSTVMDEQDPPAFTPTVTGVTSGSAAQDGLFRASVSDIGDFEVVCLVVLDGEGNYTADSHWAWMEPGADSVLLEAPLVTCPAGEEYVAKIYALKRGCPMTFCDREWTFRVTGPADLGGSEILIGALKENYVTGESVHPSVYYPNSEGLDNLTMDMAFYYADDPWFENEPNDWNLNYTVWPEPDGSLLFFPEEDWQKPGCWLSGNYKYIASVWRTDENGDRILVDSTERYFTVSSEGPIGFEPDLPEYIDASAMPYTITVPRVPDVGHYYIRVENHDDHDWEADPDWDNTIAEFSSDDPDGLPETFEISGVSQRVYIYIEAAEYNHEWYRRDYEIPVVNLGDRISLRTEDWVTGSEQPIHVEIPLWISAPGADEVWLDNRDGRFAYWSDPDEINRGIENTTGLHWDGRNYIIATAVFDGVEEQAILTVQCRCYGDAGAFTASLDKDEVTRGDPVNVTFTKSENADQYWVDLDIQNNEWNDWQWYAHLADLDAGSENDGGAAVMNTITLEPGAYRVRALAQGPGYNTAEYIITESFTVNEAVIPESGLLVNLSADRVETFEEFEVSALAPGASWMQIYWNCGEEDWGWNSHSDGRDAFTWRQSYGNPGTYQILVQAWFNEYDEDGNPVWDIDGETGEIHTDEEGNPDWHKQYCVEETFNVSVTADRGILTLDAPADIPEKLAPSEEEITISFTLEMPDNAECLQAEAWLDGVDDSGLYWGETREGSLDVSFSLKPEIGRTVSIRAWAQARGYEQAVLSFQVPVLPDGETSDLGYITVDEGNWYFDEDGLCHVPVYGHVRFVVHAAEGHTLTAVKFCGTHGWWVNGGEINHENYDEWFNTDGSAFFHENMYDESQIGRTFDVCALVRVDGGEQYYLTEPFPVHVDDFYVGSFDFADPDPVTAVYGENAVFTFTEAEGAGNYWVDAWDMDDSGMNYNPMTTCSGTTVTLNTAQLRPGKFIIRGRAGTGEMGDMREAESAVILYVTPSEVPEGSVILTVDRDEALTNENVFVSFFAPGADSVELIRVNETGDENYFCWRDGAGVSCDFSEDWARTVQVIGEAHYLMRDKNGDLIPDGEDEYGNTIWKELDPVRSEPHPVTFTSPNGKIPQDASGIPVSAEAGEALRLSMPAPENGWMNWEIYFDRDIDNDWQESDLRGSGALDLEIPADRMVLGRIIELRVWTDGYGYEHNHRNYRIFVTGGNEDRVVLTVNGQTEAEVQTNESFTVTVTAPGADYIEYNNGYGFWKNWDDETGEEVISRIGLDENGQWSNTESYGSSDTMALYARAMINGELVACNPVRVTVTSVGTVEDVPVYLERQTVTRGETAVLRYEPAEHSNENSYSLNHYRYNDPDSGEHVDYEMVNWQLDAQEHAIRFSTAGMPAGEYRLRIWVRGEQGYDGRETREVSLFVTEPETAGITFDISNPDVQTNEAVCFSAWAPGADRLEIFWITNGDSWSTDRDYYAGMYNFNEPGTYQVYARATYEQGEGLEPLVLDSDPITVTVASNGQKFSIDLSGLPAYLIAGEDAYLYVGWPEDAGYMGWEVFLNWDNNWQTEPDYRQQEGEDLSLMIPGDTLIAGATVQVRVWSSSVGYLHNHQNVNIPVLSPNAYGMTIGADTEVQTRENMEVTVTFPSGIYSEIQFYAGYNYWDQQDLDPEETVRTWDICFDRAGTYSLHARLWNSETDEWEYTPAAEVNVTAPNGPLAIDTSMVPAKIYEGADASFTLITPENADEWNYQLYDDSTGETLISWNDPKDGNVSIPAEKIFDGHRYRLDCSALATGYEAAYANLDITGAASPELILSMNRKFPKYGETVTFTVSFPDAKNVRLRLLEGDGEPTELDGFTWTADRTGPVFFEAVADLDGYDGEFISNAVSVNVIPLGPAPEAYLKAPDALCEGDTLGVTVVPPEDGWAAVSIYDSGDTPVMEQGGITEQQTVSVENVHAGAYQVYVNYGKTGYEEGMVEAEIQVAHLYGNPVWSWTEDGGEYTGATLVLSCACGEVSEPLEAKLIRVVTEEPTCEEPGEATWYASVMFNGAWSVDDRTMIIPATGHDWRRPVFTWTGSGDAVSATASFTCRNDETHTREGDVRVTKTDIHEDASCTEPESDIWTAECEGFTDEHKVTTGYPTGHSGEWYVVWNDDYSAFAERVCDTCGEYETAGLLTEPETLKEATCQAHGEVLWTASPLPGGPQVSATKKQYTPKADHTPGEPEWTEDGLEIIRCTECGAVLSCDYPHAEHAWSEPVYTWLEGNYISATRTCEATPGHPHTESETVKIVETIVQSPTETEEGIVTYAAYFTKECFEVQEGETLIIPPFGGSNVLRLPAGLTVIESEAFAGMSRIEEVIVPDGCTFIAADAFADCPSLIYISLPDYTEIEGGAFTGLVLDVVVERR